MARDSRDFCHLHLHTDHSLLDGACRTDRLMGRASELGFTSVAMTDHGNLFGAMAFYKAARKKDIKPIIGCEIYLVQDHKMDERPKRDRKRHDDINDVPEDELGPELFPRHLIHHKTILARDFEGYQNLSRLVSEAHVNGMYYRPRADMELLAKYSKGLIGLSGCINGVAATYLTYNDYENARRITADFVDIFGKENYFIELQDHGMGVQQRIIPPLLKLAKEFDLKVVATNDVHYVNRGDWEPHDALLCIQTGKRVADTDRMRYPSQEFYLKSRDEMATVFGEIPEALENTLHVADMCNIDIKFGENHYPRFERPAEVTYDEDEANFNRILDIYVEKKNEVNARQGKEPVALSAEERQTFMKNGMFLFDLCKQGLKERYGVDYAAMQRGETPDPSWKEICGTPQNEDPEFPKKICEKLDYELAIIAGAGFVDYFLITWDFINWARKKSIPVGPGRGSGAGCMVAFILKITDIEPIRFGLLFERMLSLERVSPPDFDVDFCMRRRDDVVNYVRDKYGRDHVANIITFGTFGAKMVVRDAARVFDLPYAEADRIAKMVPDDLNISLDDALEKSSELKQEVKSNPTAARIMEHGKVIEGMIRNTGKHACGIIIGDQPLTNLVPLTLQEGDLTTQYPKGPVEDLGLLKCDFLGLKTLTVISDAQENVRRTTDQLKFDIEKVTLDNEATYALLNSGRTTGVFQLESGGMQSLCRQLEVSNFEEIIALIALYRPGPMQFIPQFIEGKKDPNTIKVPHELLRDILEETYGVIVYQEQVMQAAQIVAGYTLGDADLLRRAMGKKIAEIMAQQKTIFVQGAQKTNNIPPKKGEEIFAILEKFAQYGFNKSHSAAYAMLSYRTAYLKANYPVQFMAAVLSSELGNSDKVAHFISECSAMKIAVLGPDVNESREMFTPVVEGEGTGAIRFGLAAVKGVGDLAAHQIIEEREKNGPYKSLIDLISRMDDRAINRRVMECLISSGAFDEAGHDRQHLLDSLDVVLKDAAQRKADEAKGQTNLFDMLDAGAEDEDSTATASIKTDGPCMTRADKLSHEKQLLGFYISGHPMDTYEGIDIALNSITEETLAELPDRTPVRICGVLDSVSKRIAKKSNRQWALLSLATRETTYHEITLFADAYEKFSEVNRYGRRLPDRPAASTEKESAGGEVRENASLFDGGSAEPSSGGNTATATAPVPAQAIPEEEFTPLLSEGSIVVIHAITRKQDKDVQLNAHEIAPLENRLSRLIKGVTWLIKPDTEGDAFLALLGQHVQDHDGPTRMRIAIRMKDGQTLYADPARSLSCTLRPTDFKKLKNHPGVQGYRMETEEIPEPPRRTFGGG